MRPDPERDQGLAIIGADARLRKISYYHHGAPKPFEERKSLFDAYKDELKKLRKETALECHTDRTQHLSDEEREKKRLHFIRVARAVDFVVNQLQIRPPAPVAQPLRVYIQVSGPISTSYSSTTATGWSTFSNVTGDF